MISDEVKLYTKIVEIDKTYNFVVDNFFIYDHLIVKNYYKLSNNYNYIVSHTT
jgi:hypothetical protein